MAWNDLPIKSKLVTVSITEQFAYGINYSKYILVFW